MVLEDEKKGEGRKHVCLWQEARALSLALRDGRFDVVWSSWDQVWVRLSPWLGEA